MKRSALFTLFGCLLVAFSTLSFTYSNENTEDANILLIDTRGTVLSAYPAVITFNSKTTKTRIKLIKTGGRAKTEVKVYYNDVYRGKMNFSNGNSRPTKFITITNPRNAKIKVIISNHSMTNTFKYRMVAHAIN